MKNREQEFLDRLIKAAIKWQEEVLNHETIQP